MRARKSSLWVVVLALAAVAWPAAQQQSRESWQRVGDIIEALGLTAGSHVADIGAGDGFFTLRLARAVGETGRVYAVDVSTSQLERLRARVTAAGLDNVEIIQGAQDDPRLPRDRLDAALIVNAYHEFENPAAMLANIAQALRSTGRLVLVEPLAGTARGRPREEQIRSHDLGAEHAESELRAAGYQVRRLEDPFTTRPERDRVDWLIVATPPEAVVTPIASGRDADAAADQTAAAASVVRVERDEFERLLASDAITVIDVRSEGEFRAGHIPGALSVPLDTIVRRAPDLRAAGKPIVAYCS